MVKTRSSYLFTEEEKLQIVEDHINNGISIRACATKYNIPSTSLVY